MALTRRRVRVPAPTDQACESGRFESKSVVTVGDVDMHGLAQSGDCISGLVQSIGGRVEPVRLHESGTVVGLGIVLRLASASDRRRAMAARSVVYWLVSWTRYVRVFRISWSMATASSRGYC